MTLWAIEKVVGMLEQERGRSAGTTLGGMQVTSKNGKATWHRQAGSITEGWAWSGIQPGLEACNHACIRRVKTRVLERQRVGCV